MKITRSLFLLAAFLSPTMLARAKATSAARVGDTFEITRIKDTSTQSGEASSGSSHDQDTLIERVEAVRPDGVELIVNLPQGATTEERRQVWQFPARVLKPFRGPAQLLNGPELNKRLDAWLKWGKMTRKACGHWVFTWNAFRIECDPESVLQTLQAFDPDLPQLTDGAFYHDDHALRAAPLKRRTLASGSSTFSASLALNPEAVQRDRAEADVVVGEITRRPLTLAAALAKRAGDTVSGTIKVTIDTDRDGEVRRFTKVTKSQTKAANGNVQSEMATETLERRFLQRR